MVAHAPLPDELARRAFSIADATARGVTARRLRGSDLTVPFRGVRTAGPVDDAQLLAAAFARRMRPGHVFAGVTAARIWGLPVRNRWHAGEPLTVGVPAGSTRTRVRAVRTREFDPRRLSVGMFGQLPVLLPASAVMSMARETPHADLVALIDALLTPSRRYRDLRLPSRPYASTADLEAFAERCRGMHGAGAFVTALAAARPGADSPRESHSRLAIVAAGLPEPAMQHEVWVDGACRAVLDLSYPDLLIAIEYEGEHHLTDPEQWSRDIRRQELLESLGWIVIRITKADLRDGGRGLARRVRAAIARRAPVV